MIVVTNVNNSYVFCPKDANHRTFSAVLYPHVLILVCVTCSSSLEVSCLETPVQVDKGV